MTRPERFLLILLLGSAVTVLPGCDFLTQKSDEEGNDSFSATIDLPGHPGSFRVQFLGAAATTSLNGVDFDFPVITASTAAIADPRQGDVFNLVFEKRLNAPGTYHWGSIGGEADGVMTFTTIHLPGSAGIGVFSSVGGTFTLDRFEGNAPGNRITGSFETTLQSASGQQGRVSGRFDVRLQAASI